VVGRRRPFDDIRSLPEDPLGGAAEGELVVAKNHQDPFAGGCETGKSELAGFGHVLKTSCSRLKSAVVGMDRQTKSAPARNVKSGVQINRRNAG
jgi:hypothetical protein